ncbi:hypothetical protein HAX54_014437 [Datura stramonium]|uniref:Guanine nucleotide-binding protein subunit beta-like protein n=1 Tax=Datura stramonium TaxID=4076 RepID=A0ABS8RK61_DATST|nr:hypothetical protein [Datura stramonium]
MAQESLVLRGVMKAHTDWVTAIATPVDNSDMIVTSSRDKSIIVWHLTKDGPQYGVPHRRLTKATDTSSRMLSSHPTVCLLSLALGTEASQDLQAGTTARRFVGHTKDVLSVAFSVDNRQIVSASPREQVHQAFWNTLGSWRQGWSYFALGFGEGRSSTLLTLAPSFILSALVLTGIGSAQPPSPALRFGTWRARASWSTLELISSKRVICLLPKEELLLPKNRSFTAPV